MYTADDLQELNLVENSRYNFRCAQELAEKDDFAAAIASYQRVIPEDTVNYAMAQEAVPKTAHLWCVQAADQAEALIAKGDYIAAYQELFEVDPDYADGEIERLLDDAMAKGQRSVYESVDTLYLSGDYVGVCTYMDNCPEVFVSGDSKDVRTRAENAYAEIASSRAETKAAAGDYNGAIAVLTEAYTRMPLPAISEKEAEYRKAKDIAFLKSRKSSVLLAYNAENKIYNIVPKTFPPIFFTLIPTGTLFPGPM